MTLLGALGRRIRARKALPETLEVDGLSYAVRWSARRRTIEIAIGARGELRIAAPRGCGLPLLVAFARQKDGWVRAKRAARLALPPSEAPRFAEGGELPFLGRSYPIVCSERRRPAVRFCQDRFEIAAESQEAGRSHFLRWARREAEVRLLPRLAELAASSGWSPSATRVREMRRRWGSCSRDGRISLNWRLVLLAPALADYVLVHELAHLVEPNHGAGFWRLVEAEMPDFRARRAALRRAGAAIEWTWEPSR